MLLSVPTPIPGLLGPAPPAVFILPITHLKGATQPGLKSYIVSGCQSLSKASYPHHLLERVKRYGFPIGCWDGASWVSGGGLFQPPLAVGEWEGINQPKAMDR